jgi:hypothetical protein
MLSRTDATKILIRSIDNHSFPAIFRKVNIQKKKKSTFIKYDNILSMKKVLILSAIFWSSISSSQDLNWNTVSYTTGSLSANFGSIGSPASTVSMNITGNTNRIDAGFPVKYIANPPGSADDCSVNCALRSSVTFASLAETIIYTFSFSPAVSGLSFRIYDIDGTNASSGDQANVTASGPSGAEIITLTNLNTPASTITGSGTTSATVTGTQGNTGDHQTNVSISGFVSTLVIVYANNPANPAAGNRSFSIGNMDWTGVLPVRWISFSGRMQASGSVDLNWITETEINASHYEIERSKDGQNYTAIGQLAARGGGRNTYLFTDASPGPGNSFYRIRQVDIGGRFEFSNIVLIRPGKNNGSGFTITPNPASQYILVSSAANVQISRLQLYDVTGRLLYESKTGMNRIDISSFRPGLYNVKIENKSGDIFTESFIKR